MNKAEIIVNASQILTLEGNNEKPRTKEGMSDLGVLDGKGNAVAIYNGMIVATGTEEHGYTVLKELGIRKEQVERIDAEGKLVMPGLIDPHTHLVFAGSREYELELRMNGATYLEILAKGGGILSTTRLTRAASEQQLMNEARPRLDAFLLHGVTTVEAKSGYGLTVEDELKQLRVAKRLSNEHPVELISTFMGAHAIPQEFKENPEAYVDLIINEMLPRVAEEKLAEFCDVFCEHGVFTVEQSERILEAGKALGLRAKIHADEIEPMGGAELAAKVGAISADHLLKASDEGIKAMAEAGVVATLLPGTAFFLMAEFARGRKMVDSGVPVALSTDRNPGSSPTENLQLIMNLACFHMKMTPAEVIVATTINAAHAIGQAKRIGSLEAGKQADIVFMNVPTYQYLQYNYGVNHVDTVIKAGHIVVQGGHFVHGK
ncbi:imidazolonepropionase [Brevibacillus sp. SYSU BS000544]|uniref:imidazolonepropionase n=1 Tax=Brevibacillus sp. SYSU BS000544 TaxID=3416443 RepID=UPI003CE529A5